MSHYGTIEDANNFFANRLNKSGWQGSTDADKVKALEHATNLINQFNFVGEKIDSLGENEFPRTGIGTPEPINRATYLIAGKLLDGYDPSFSSQSGTYGNARLNISNRIESEKHLIPSSQAFNLIKPFLRVSDSFEVRRV